MESKLTGVLYAVFRVGKKYKSLPDIKGFQRHMQREQETPNADEGRTINNRILIGDEDVYKCLYNHIQGVKMRKNGNLGTEILLTASQGYFKGITKDQKEAWVQANLNFIKEHFGESCIYAILHEDETTPHIHALISNKVIDKRGNTIIANSRYFDGPEMLRQWQDTYAAAMAEFNLSRGIRFSRATHVRIRQFYSLVENNISIDKLNRVIDNAYRFSAIKDQFVSIIEDLEEHKRPDNAEDMNKLKAELYRLSNLTTAPEKFYSEEKEGAQRKVVEDLMEKLGIPEGAKAEYLDRLTEINRSSMQERKETSREAYARIIAETQVKREVLELKKILNKLTSDNSIMTKEQEKLRARLSEMRKDKEVFALVIKTLSEYYYIPQNTIESLVGYAKGKTEGQEQGKERSL